MDIVSLAHVGAITIVASSVEQCDVKCLHALTNAILGSRILVSTP